MDMENAHDLDVVVVGAGNDGLVVEHPIYHF